MKFPCVGVRREVDDPRSDDLNTCPGKRCRLAALVILALGALGMQGPWGMASGVTAIDEAFAVFWEADSPAEARQAIAGVLTSGVTFDEAYRRLAEGRDYGP